MLPALSQGTFIEQEVEGQVLGVLFIRSIDMGNVDDRQSSDIHYKRNLKPFA